MSLGTPENSAIQKLSIIIICWLKYLGFGDPLVGNKWVAVHKFAKRSVSELRSCVKVEVAVLGSLSLTVRTVFVDVKQH